MHCVQNFVDLYSSKSSVLRCSRKSQVVACTTTMCDFYSYGIELHHRHAVTFITIGLNDTRRFSYEPSHGRRWVAFMFSAFPVVPVSRGNTRIRFRRLLNGFQRNLGKVMHQQIDWLHFGRSCTNQGQGYRIRQKIRIDIKPQRMTSQPSLYGLRIRHAKSCLKVQILAYLFK